MPFPPANAVVSNLINTNFFGSDEGKQLYELVSSGKGFQNVLEPTVTGVQSIIDSEVIPGLDSLIADAGGLIPTTTYTEVELQGLKDKIVDDFLPAQESFLEHTNLISGVTNTTNSDIPSFRSIMSLGTASVALDNTLNELAGNQCGKLFNAFGSLYLGADQYVAIQELYQTIIGELEAGEADIAILEGKIESAINTVTDLVENDKQYFNGLADDLIYYSMTATLPGFANDPCGKFILENLVGTSDLLDII